MERPASVEEAKRHWRSGRVVSLLTKGGYPAVISASGSYALAFVKDERGVHAVDVVVAQERIREKAWRAWGL